MEYETRRSTIHIGWAAPIVLATVLSLLPWGVEGAVPDFPLIEIEVHQSRGQVHFLCYWAKRQADGRRVPVRVHDVMVYEVMSPTPPESLAKKRGEIEIWRVYLPKGYPVSSVVTYGVVPTGFVQDVPNAGPAPPLEPNRRYHVGVNGEGGMGATTFVYTGQQ